LELNVLYSLGVVTVKDSVEKIDGDLFPLILTENELEQDIVHWIVFFVGDIVLDSLLNQVFGVCHGNRAPLGF
jgi:hypothetical protein